MKAGETDLKSISQTVISTNSWLMGFRGWTKQRCKQEVCSISGFHMEGRGRNGVRQGGGKAKKKKISGNNNSSQCVCVWMCERYLSSHTLLTAGDKHRPVLLTTWFINTNFTLVPYLSPPSPSPSLPLPLPSSLTIVSGSAHTVHSLTVKMH